METSRWHRAVRSHLCRAPALCQVPGPQQVNLTHSQEAPCSVTWAAWSTRQRLRTHPRLSRLQRGGVKGALTREPACSGWSWGRHCRSERGQRAPSQCRAGKTGLGDRKVQGSGRPFPQAVGSGETSVPRNRAEPDHSSLCPPKLPPVGQEDRPWPSRAEAVTGPGD